MNQSRTPLPATVGGALTRRSPRVFFHIGEPKTGTTFLQDVMWRNRSALASQGVALPGHHVQDHFRASHDLRGVIRPPDDPAGAWDGEWELVAAEARQTQHTAVISHELFCAVDAHQAARAMRSMSGAEVHLVVTVRDLASLLPAEWQESVKHRTTTSWWEWLAGVVDREALDPDRRRFWFWRVHDTAKILEIWSRWIPPEQVHVITVPRPGSPEELLWPRFASVLGIDPGSVDVTRADPNMSLGIPETEFLRRLNQQLPDEVPEWFYMGRVKEAVARHAFAGRPRYGRLVVPDERLPWVAEYAAGLIETLKQSSFDIVGDLDDLRPARAPGPAVVPGDETAEEMLDAAMTALVAVLVNEYRRAHPAISPHSTATPGLLGRVESAVAASPRLRRTVRDLSGRHASVRRLRILAWRAMERNRVNDGG